MKNSVFSLSMFFIVAFPGILHCDDEVELIKSFLSTPYEVELIKTGKKAVTAKSKHDPYMKNPSFSMSIEKPFDDSSYAFKFAEFGFEFDVSGKYILGKEVAGFKKLRAGEQIKASLVESVANFRALLAKFFYLNRKKEIIKVFELKIETLSKELSILVEGKNSSKFDLMRIESQVLSHKRKSLEIESELAAVRSQIQSFCGIEIDELSLQEPELIEFEELKRRAFLENPQIKQIHFNLSESEKEMAVEKRKTIPDPGLQIGFIHEKMQGVSLGFGIDIGISFDLPFFDFNRKGVAESVYENQQKKMDLFEKKFFVDLQISELYKKADHLIKGFIPDQNKDDILEKSFFLYKAGEISVSDLISTLYEVEEIHFSEIEIKEKIHFLTLQLYAAAGFFENEKINDLIGGAVK
ncbi:MAG TPA: hypothetical protein PLW78_11180 [bacterium]|jgi:hypothetical protein|nr:hypothetical protein [bacterium]HPM47315.1 hypothetical protein [bacterium]HRQ70852.1 hypothetical protein [bacterium]